MYTPLKLFKFSQKSSQSFLDNSCNLFESKEKIPKECMENYMKNINMEEQQKCKKLAFHIFQNKIRNFIELNENDFTVIKDFQEEEKINLLKTYNEIMVFLLNYVKLQHTSL
jgi:hypothetical protein